MYYSNGNYEAFAHPRKPEGVDNKSAYLVGAGKKGKGGCSRRNRTGLLLGQGRGSTKKSAYLVPAAVRVSKREQSSGHYPFEGCGSRYDGDHEGSTCAGNQRSYSLFFLF